MNTLDPALNIYIGRDKYYHESIIELGKRLPPEDEVLAEWIESAARQSDQAQFLFLLYSAIHAGRKVHARHLVRGLQFLPTEADVLRVPFHLEGNVAEALTEAIRTVMAAPGRMALALLTGALWCKKRQQPIPPDLIAQARMVSRKFWKSSDVAVQIRTLALIADVPVLHELVREMTGTISAEKLANLEKVILNYRDAVYKDSEGPILELVPKTPPTQSRVLASGTTMRRAVPRVGRNDPCPCGSGRKYKQCCADKDVERLHHSSHVAGKTAEEVDREPEPHLTSKDLLEMHPFKLARLDPLKIKPELWEDYFANLGGKKLFDTAIASFEKLGYPESLFDAWNFVVFWATHERDGSALRRLMQMPPYPPQFNNENRAFGMDLLLQEDDPAAQIKLLNDKALSMLDESEGDKLRSFAWWMLRSRKFQWLGVFVARGIIPLISDEQAGFLLKFIIELRDEANLPADDPASDLVDKRLVKDREHEANGHDAAAYRKAQRNLENKASEVRELKETLARLQRDIRLNEKKARREESSSVSAPAASPEEARRLAELRQQLEEVKSTLKHTHTERNEFRYELEKANRELKTLRETTITTPTTETQDQENTLLLPDEPSGNQPVRTIEFPRQFEETLRNLPRQTARKAMVTLGQIAGGEPAGLAGARRLIGCPDITRQRIGSDYRLLFRLLPNCVQVVDLINRRDLERTIKSLR